MEFTKFGKRVVLGAFDGGEITSDAGVMLLREASNKLNLASRMAACFSDHRDQIRVKHNLSDMLAQRVMGIALGYEDLNDHDHLRNDPALKLISTKGAPSSLAGSATLGRIERSFENGDRRYHKILPSLSSLQELYTQIFVESYNTPPEHITLDIDATDIITHGHQERGCFNAYYEHRCFLPLYIYCGPHLLLAQLRSGNDDPGKRAKKEIKRLVIQIRQHWPKVKILVRGDSGFVRKNLMNWCEANDVDYIFGLARNSYLLHKARKIRSRASLQLIETKTTVMMFGHFNHQTRSKTWKRPRHIIAKILHKPGHDQRCRFLVTSLDWNNPLVIDKMKLAKLSSKQEKHAPTKDLMPRAIYDKIYCPRGDMENRIKDCQLDLFGDRTSAHDYRANQLRLILAGFAYVLTTYIRLKALAKTSLAKASPNTIRLKLFKIGAKVTTSLRRIKISMPDAYPYKHDFFIAWLALAPI